MRKEKLLTYWVADCIGDSKAYSIRGRTKKEVQAEVRRQNDSGHGGAYGEPRKHEVFYTDAFDLLDFCLSEARANE
jgi:hypothetical protein